MNLIPDPATPPPAGETPPPAGDPPAGDPPAGDPPVTVAKPDYLPDELWTETGFNQAALDALMARPVLAEDLPAEPTGYVIPAIEGLDVEAAAASPLVKALQTHAHKHGMGQAAFDALLADYVAGEAARDTEARAEQMRALGENAAPRLAALGTWIDTLVTPEEAAALRASMTSAAAITGLEKLRNARAAPASPPPAVTVQVDTREDIVKLMATPAYRGTAAERDPAVIKRVEEFYAREAAKK